MKDTALGNTNTYNWTYAHLFALKMNYINQNREKTDQRLEGLKQIKLGIRPSPPSVSVNNVLLEHSYHHSFAYYL